MRKLFPAAVLALVFAESAAFIAVGSLIGIGPTLALVLVSMLAGVWLLRRQGLAALRRVRDEAAAGRSPAAGLIEAALLAGAAVLMIVPGLIGSAVGALLFVPPFRAALRRRIGRFATVAASRDGRPWPVRHGVLELDRGDYTASPAPDSPWRPSRGPSGGEAG